MEFLEYYHLIRQRIWIVILAIATVVALVTVRELLPPSKREARGRLRVDEAGKNVLVYSGGRLEIRQREEFWRGFGSLIESREILDTAATRAGLTGPEIRARLQPLEASQPSAGNLIDVTGAAPTAEMAQALTQRAMEYVGEYWSEHRIAIGEQIREALTELRQQRVAVQEAAQERVDRLRGAGLSPAEELARAESDLSVTKSQIDGAEQAVSLARYRLRAAEQIAAGEARRPPEQRVLAPASFSPLETQIQGLRVQLAAELARRTPDHPEVKDLQRQIELLESTLVEPEETAEGQPRRPALSREVIDARLALDEANSRLALLQERAALLRRSLSALRTGAAEFQVAESELVRATGAVQKVDEQLAMVDTEVSRLQAQPEVGAEADEEAVRDVDVLDEAEVRPLPRSKRKFALTVFAAVLGGALLSSLVILALHYTSVAFTNEVEARTMLRRRILGGIPRSDLPTGEAGPPIQVQ